MLSAVVVIALCTVHVHVVWAQALQGTIVPGERFFSFRFFCFTLSAQLNMLP
jgi:hypothetical protein